MLQTRPDNENDPVWFYCFHLKFEISNLEFGSFTSASAVPVTSSQTEAS
jgi:hypothetical protein